MECEKDRHSPVFYIRRMLEINILLNHVLERSLRSGDGGQAMSSYGVAHVWQTLAAALPAPVWAFSELTLTVIRRGQGPSFAMS